MLQQDLHTKAYQDEAGDDVGGALRDGDVALAEVDAQEGDQCGDDTDGGDNPQDGSQRIVQPQADTDGESVDAGGDTEEEESGKWRVESGKMG